MTLVSDLTLAIRQRADMVNSQFVSDAELITYLNASAEELYGLISQGNKDYNIQKVVISFISDGYTLPADFWQMRGLDRQGLNGNSWFEIHPEPSYHERNRGNSGYVAEVFFDGTPVIRYSCMPPTLTLTPAQSAPGTYRLSYVPRATTYANPTDVITDFLTINGWTEYIITDCASKCFEKEESYEQANALTQRKLALAARIKAESASLDAGESQVIGRIRRHGHGFGGYGFGW